MDFTKRQLVLLTTALTLFYDEIAKTASAEMKTEVMEIAQMVQDAYGEAEWDLKIQQNGNYSLTGFITSGIV